MIEGTKLKKEFNPPCKLSCLTSFLPPVPPDRIHGSSYKRKNKERIALAETELNGFMNGCSEHEEPENEPDIFEYG
jgi:hypothetical protein